MSLAEVIPNEILEIVSSIREGGLSSPSCFNMHVNDLITSLKRENVGIKIGFILICI